MSGNRRRCSTATDSSPLLLEGGADEAASASVM
jgi:hypothetical protein